MASAEERMRVLKMIESGQISAEEGARLLSALAGQPADEEPRHDGLPRWFRIRITDLESGKQKVNVSLPINLVNVGMKMGARFAPHFDEGDIETLRQAVQRGVVGKVIDIEDASIGERVEIFVE